MAMAFHVVSYPKSGRTWLRVMLDDLGIEALYTRDGSGFEEHASIANLDADKTKFAAGLVLLLVRDPRDVVISGFFQVVRRLRLPTAGAMSISDFIRHPRYGIEKAVKFNLHWFAAARDMSDLAIVRYEDLHQGTSRALTAIVRFACTETATDVISDVALRRSFAHMRQLEADGGFAARYGNALTPADLADPESYKVRRGMVGGYVDYLSRDDQEFCNRIVGETDYGLQLRYAVSRRSVLRCVAEAGNSCA
jgi:Sulfotransferase domain